MATLYYLSPFASFLQLLNDAGIVQPGLLMWTYEAGTSTPTATWTDNTGNTPNSNPVQLNSAGRLPNVSVWQAGGVPIKIQFSTNSGTVGSPVFGTQIGPTFDQVSGIDDPAATLAALSSASSGSGADLVANAMRSYDIFSSVRSANVPSLVAGQTLIIDTEGASSVGDNMGGLFYWSASSTATDDGATVLKPNASSGAGRYLRLVLPYTSLNTSYAFNSVTQNRASDTAPTIDTYLQVDNLVAGVYVFKCLAYFYGDSPGTQGFKFRVLTVNGNIGYSQGVYYGIAQGSPVSGQFELTGITFVTFSNISFPSAAAPDWVCAEGTISLTAGDTIGLFWSQGSSSADQTYIKQGSYLNVQRIA